MTGTGNDHRYGRDAGVAGAGGLAAYEAESIIMAEMSQAERRVFQAQRPVRLAGIMIALVGLSYRK
jgi:hypothetical protein